MAVAVGCSSHARQTAGASSAAATVPPSKAGVASAAPKAPTSTATPTTDTPSAAAPREPSPPVAFESTYRGSVAGKPVQARLEREGEEVTGAYRYGKALQDLLLTGKVDNAGTFELEERTEDGDLTGYWKGNQLERLAVSGIWLSPDRTRQYPLELAPGEFVPLVRIGQKLRLYPLTDAKSQPGCSYDLTLPQLGNLGDKSLESQLNQQLRDLGAGGFAQYCDDVAADQDPPANASRAYSVTAIRLPFVALRFDTEFYAGGAHGGHLTDCHVLDTSTGKHFSLVDKLSPSARKRLSKLLNQAKKDDLDVQAIESDGMTHTAELQITPASALCLTETGIDIQLADYELGAYAFGRPSYSFRADELRGLFEPALSRALFPE